MAFCHMLLAGTQPAGAQTLKGFQFLGSRSPTVDFTAKVLNDIAANAMDIRNRQFAAITSDRK